MQIILTHDQADFDALAAMLGAHLLNEQAIPVLPHRMNRNLRAFLNLYGSELPFVETGDLPDEPIQSVTLVDTQSLVTLKGLNQHTDVHVVDHHPRRTDLPTRWTITQESLGATTTLFVESLREHNGALNFIHATLLLLGIYEDTGSLTYASTTARDAQAVAFLLEQERQPADCERIPQPASLARNNVNCKTSSSPPHKHTSSTANTSSSPRPTPRK